MRPRLLLFLMLLVFPAGVLAATVQLPETGQATVYAGRDDGALQQGTAWPSPRFADNGDGTVTDNLTGLIWLKNANCTETVGGIVKGGAGSLPWADALTWSNHLASGSCGLSGDTNAGDWRLPNVKELESIVDYTRSPDTAGSPAIDPLFTCTRIVNEIAQGDYPYYWTSTTHASLRGGENAVYIAFGRAGGWPSGPPEAGGGTGQPGARRFVDVHGAGAQRSDPKSGDPQSPQWATGLGPQGDEIRIFNYARAVRNIDPAAVRLVEPNLTALPAAPRKPQGPPGLEPGGPPGFPPGPPPGYPPGPPPPRRPFRFR
jgi:hypothetical protein